MTLRQVTEIKVIFGTAGPVCAVVVGVGFEPTKAEPADLQSAPVDRLGTPPETQAVNFG